ncbi:primosomal protein N' [bacterium]|nr:primosomal protein N' [bacterium]
MTDFIDIILPIPLNKALTYHSSNPLQTGLRVLTPLGTKKAVGFVFKSHANPEKTKTKGIYQVLDKTPLLTPAYLEWLLWASQYYMAPLGEVLAAAIPSPLFEAVSDEKIRTRKSRAQSQTVLDTPHQTVTLNPEQKGALDLLIQDSNTGQYSAHLLHGITGSGKTEVYIELAKHILKSGKQVMVLVPEIGLTPQALARFQKHFGNEMGVFHSNLTQNQRLLEWLKCESGENKMIIGTRSALFAPFKNLGAIIIDEEHDSSYKQEERFRYHARDLAMVRAKMEKAIVLLGSATPSLESMANVEKGKLKIHTLTTRATGQKMPEVLVVNMAAQKRQTTSPLDLSVELIKAIEYKLKQGEQVMILQNKRGYASAIFCTACEKALTCPHCSVPYTYHKHGSYMLCHYCDHKEKRPDKCTLCGEPKITMLGTGIQTIEEQVKVFFPKARVARLDRDSTKKKNAMADILQQLADRKIDILLGTQMIAKGHDFHGVTLVGIVGVDLALSLPDFRSAERTFQLITQVSGRAGRGDKPGHVIIQSYGPHHYSIDCASQNDYARFVKTETDFRREWGYPPYGRMIAIKLSSPQQNILSSFCSDLERKLEKQKFPVSVLGPAPQAIEKIRNQYRWHLLIKGTKEGPVHQVCRQILDMIGKPSKIRVSVDVDPMSMI